MLALSLNKNSSLKLIDKKLNSLKREKYRIKILYSSICASDIPRAFHKGTYNYPLVMGHEMSGRIVEIRSKKKKYKVNDLVSIYPLIPNCKKCPQCKKGNFNLCDKYSYFGSREDGGFAEFLDVNEWNIFKLNKKINIKLASLIEPTAVSHNVYDKIKNKSKKDKILIIGCGFLGQILARILYQNNFKNITCVDRNKFKVDFLKNFSKNQVHGDLIRMKNLKFDCIVDFIGTKCSFDFALSNLNPKGKFVLPANIYKNFLLEKKILSLVARKEIVIEGVWNSTYKNKKSNWVSAEKFLIKNEKDIFKLVTHEIKLSNLDKFFKVLYNSKKFKYQKKKYLKVIIKN